MNLPYSSFMELHGDRVNSDDKTIRCGFATVSGQRVMAISCIGSARTGGYRKAHRCMRLAAKFNLPVVTFIDTPGAWPIEAGISYAIAQNLRLMAFLPVPIVSIVLGRAYSGGALGLMVADHIGMLPAGEYSVISPKGCAAVLKAPNEEERIRKALKVTPKDALRFGAIDHILSDEAEIPEFIIKSIRQGIKLSRVRF